jgi:DNA polymerase I-like protein with 3'-5' exonuclease and polymerase domains
MAGIERSQAKTINLGLMYGMGKNKLMAELGLMKEAAEKLIAQYHKKAPFIKQLMQAVSRRADESGRIRTIGGRVCHFDLWEPTTWGEGLPKPHAEAIKEYGHGIKRAGTYKALNRLIQGSAADMTKLSIIALSEAGIVPHIQIHDELDISVEHSEQARQIVEIMESAIKLEIPNKVDYECGDSWGSIK